MEVFTLAERPDLSDAAFGIEYADGDGSAFMQGSMVAILTRSRRLAECWADHVLVLIDDDRVVARAVSVPFSTTRDDRSVFPDGGWDQVAIWAAEDAIDGVRGDVVCALEIAVDPTLRNQGLSVAALHALKANVVRLGFDRLVAPARPPGKSHFPFEPIDSYVLRRRPDGQPEDWWLRVHERAGGRFTSIARFSATVQADLAEPERYKQFRCDLRERVMYVELKAGAGSAWIGRVQFSKTGRTVYYRGRKLERIRGGGISSNHVDTETGEEFWVSGAKKNGQDRHWAEGGREHDPPPGQSTPAAWLPPPSIFGGPMIFGMKVALPCGHIASHHCKHGLPLCTRSPKHSRPSRLDHRCPHAPYARSLGRKNQRRGTVVASDVPGSEIKDLASSGSGGRFPMSLSEFGTAGKGAQ